MSENNEENGNGTENNEDKRTINLKVDFTEKESDLLEAKELLNDLRTRASDATGKDMSKASFQEVKTAIAEKQKRKERERKSGTYGSGGGASGKAPLDNPNDDNDLYRHEFESTKEMLSTLKELEKSGNPEQKLEAKAILEELREKGLRKNFKVEVDILRPQREKWREISEQRDKQERGENQA